MLAMLVAICVSHTSPANHVQTDRILAWMNVNALNCGEELEQSILKLGVETLSKSKQAAKSAPILEPRISDSTNWSWR